jgi:hypothetical protein
MPRLVITDEDRECLAAKMRPITVAMNALGDEMRAGAEHALAEVGAVLRKPLPSRMTKPPPA